MDDFGFWFYIIAAVIYFLTRGKKKNRPTTPPGSENRKPAQPKSFEELLREITEGTADREPSFDQEPVTVSEPERHSREETFEREGNQRAFADEESKRVYEESIKMADGFDKDSTSEEPDHKTKILKVADEEEYTFADEIRDGLSSDEARKAIIYSEILNRKY